MRKIRMDAARTDAQLKQIDIARRIGVSVNTVIDWEKGRKVPTEEQFVAYCEACGFKPTEVKGSYISVVES